MANVSTQEIQVRLFACSLGYSAEFKYQNKGRKQNEPDDLIHMYVSKDPVGWAPHLFLGVTRG